MAPLFSVITPTFNRATVLEEAIRSVLDQNDPDCQHVIVDGGSTDGTREILQRFPHLVWISEPDNGMYEALNKALSLATGDFVIWLNSDDLLAPGLLLEARQRLSADPSLDVLAFGMEVVDLCTGQRLEHTPAIPCATPFSIRPVPNAKVYRRRLMLDVGGFRPLWRIAGDLEFMLRLVAAGPLSLTVPQIGYVARAHTDSLTYNDNRGARGQMRLEMALVMLSSVEYLAKTGDLPAARRSAHRLLRRAIRYGKTGQDLMRYAPLREHPFCEFLLDYLAGQRPKVPTSGPRWQRLACGAQVNAALYAALELRRWARR
jgi:glycosyltransferase involved in cell wall biosynthesis